MVTNLTETDDWTVNPLTGRTNDSDKFHELVTAVAILIHNDAHTLLRGGVHSTARLIVAQLAHKHGMVPIDDYLSG